MQWGIAQETLQSHTRRYTAREPLQNTCSGVPLTISRKAFYAAAYRPRHMCKLPLKDYAAVDRSNRDHSFVEYRWTYETKNLLSIKHHKCSGKPLTRG